ENLSASSAPRGPAFTMSLSKRENSRCPPGFSTRRHSSRQRSYSSMPRFGEFSGTVAFSVRYKERAETTSKWFGGNGSFHNFDTTRGRWFCGPRHLSGAPVVFSSPSDCCFGRDPVVTV